MDIQQSILEKEATRFAFSIGAERELEMIRICWEACASYLVSQIESDFPESIGPITLIESMLGNEIIKKIDFETGSE